MKDLNLILDLLEEKVFSNNILDMKEDFGLKQKRFQVLVLLHHSDISQNQIKIH